MSEVIGVGLVGASAKPMAWSSRAHIPAIRLLPEFELRAIASSSPATADLAGQVHGVPAAHGDYRQLLDRPDVDLVVVSVRVPLHREIIGHALDAGKMVLSDWPLGVTADEAAELAARAQAAGVRNFVVLQGRFAPGIRYVRALLDEGYVGDVVSTTLMGSALGWPAQAIESTSYMYDRAAGVTMLTVATMHNLDAFRAIFGDVETVTAQIHTKQPIIAVDGATTITSTAPDHITLTGTLANDVLFTCQYRAGRSRGENLYWHIKGTEGELVIRGAHAGNLANVKLEISGGNGAADSLSPIAIPDSYLAADGIRADDVVANVARLYRQLAVDVQTGSSVVPDFQYAAGRARLVSAIEQASQAGVLISIPL